MVCRKVIGKPSRVGEKPGSPPLMRELEGMIKPLLNLPF
jgi:hypothetical protein